MTEVENTLDSVELEGHGQPTLVFLLFFFGLGASTGEGRGIETGVAPRADESATASINGNIASWGGAADGPHGTKADLAVIGFQCEDGAMSTLGTVRSRESPWRYR